MRAERVGRLWLLALVAALGCAAPERPPNVLLLVLDTLRADRLGSYGSQRALTPFLDELAARGAVFERTYAPSSWTPPSVASLLTSRDPLQHRVAEFESTLAPGELTLAEHFAARGYRTVGVSANRLIAAEKGFAQGFSSWQTLPGARPGSGLPPKARSRVVNDAFLTWLDGAGARSGGEPTFAYLHYMDPHSPYVPQEPFRSRHARTTAAPEEALAANRTLTRMRFRHLDDGQVALLESLYDAEVAGLDAALRRLFEALSERGFLDDALVVVVADHGEEFREHGMLLHGLNLHEESVRVPFLVAGPGVAGGQRVERNVSLLDVAPTIAELAGVGGEVRFAGRSLAPLLRGGDASTTPRDDVVLELEPKRTGPLDLRAHAWGIVRGPHKLLVDPAGGITRFDLARDPGEQAPRAGSGGGDDAALAQALERARVQLGRDARAGDRVELDAETREALRELGYAP